MRRAFPTDSGYVHVGYRAINAPNSPYGIVRSDHSRSTGIFQLDINPDDGTMFHAEGQDYMSDDSCLMLMFQDGLDAHRVNSPCPKEVGLCKAPIGDKSDDNGCFVVVFRSAAALLLLLL